MSDNFSYDYAVVEKPKQKSNLSQMKFPSQDLGINMYDEVGEAEDSKQKPQSGGKHNYEDVTSGINYFNGAAVGCKTENAVHYDIACYPTAGYSHIIGSQSPPLMSPQNSTFKKEIIFSPEYENTNLGNHDHVATTLRKETQCTLHMYLIPCLFLLSILIVAAVIALIIAFVLIADLQADVTRIMAVPRSLESTSPPENTQPLQINISKLNNSFQSFVLEVRNNFSATQFSFSSIKAILESQIDNLTSVEEKISNIQNETKIQVSDLKEVFMKHIDDHYLKISSTIYELLHNSSTSISNTRNDLESRYSELSSKLVHDLQELIEFESCDDINMLSLPFTSGYYHIKRPNGSAQTYCEIFSCNGITRGWRQIAYLNTSDPSAAQCPENFVQNTLFIGLSNTRKVCIRDNEQGGCSSVVYSTSGIPYSRVCGRITSFQSGSPDAFHDGGGDSIEGNYVDGVSLTYGMNPRTHIWTLASRVSAVPNCQVDCRGVNVPDFISSNYSCQSTSRCNSNNGCLVWNGNQCVGEKYFDRTLDQTTTDDVEMRVCRSSSRNDEDFRLSLVEIYVQ